MALPVLRRRDVRPRDRREHRPAAEGHSGPGDGSARRVVAYRTPGAELAELHERMGRMLHDAFGPGFWPATELGVGPGRGEVFTPDGVTGWCPAADVEETDDAYVVELELPGVKREDVSVEFGAGELFVHGELKRKERMGFLRHRTRPVGRFDYRIALPTEAVEEHVNASLADGVLTVRVPKTERSRRRKIAITSS